jgi:hypothetical protein
MRWSRTTARHILTFKSIVVRAALLVARYTFLTYTSRSISIIAMSWLPLHLILLRWHHFTVANLARFFKIILILLHDTDRTSFATSSIIVSLTAITNSQVPVSNVRILRKWFVLVHKRFASRDFLWWIFKFTKPLSDSFSIPFFIHRSFSSTDSTSIDIIGGVLLKIKLHHICMYNITALVASHRLDDFLAGVDYIDVHVILIHLPHKTLHVQNESNSPTIIQTVRLPVPS